MRAEVGDVLVGPGIGVGYGELLGVVTEVHGADGGPPYLVRMFEDERERLLWPDPARYWFRCHRTGSASRPTDLTV